MMTKGTYSETKILDLPKIEDPRGNLTVIEQLNHIPFEIKRCFMVSNELVEGKSFCCSGEAFVVALKGTLEAVVVNEGVLNTFTLDRLYKGLYIPKDKQATILPTDSCVLLLLAQDSGAEDICLSLDNAAGFPLKRVFYTYDVPDGEDRGAHAHINCHQYIVDASGAFDVTLDDGKNKRTVRLAKPGEGIHIPSGVWASEQNYTKGSICLVLASHEYNEGDYIRNYNEFLKYTESI